MAETMRSADQQYPGLTQQEVSQRRAIDGYNELPKSEEHGWWRTVKEVLTEPMLILLLVIGAIYLMLGNHEEAIILLVFVNVVILIALVQKNRAERSLEKLRDLSSPRALVIREHVRERIAARELVVGDVIVLSEGDRVPADVVVLSSLDMMVDESLLTGEAVPVTKIPWDGKQRAKSPGGNRQAYAYASTLVTRGLGIARVVGTGLKTEVGKIGLTIAGISKDPTRLEKDISKLVLRLAYLSLGVCLLATALFGIIRGNWVEALLTGLSLSMALIPEEIPVVLIIFLALGAWRLSKSNVLTRRMSAIETLGAITVLCVDKTGTLTMNRMKITWLHNAEGDSRTIEGSVDPEFHELVITAFRSSLQTSADPMEKAVEELREAADISLPRIRDGLKPLYDHPVTSTGMVRMSVYGMRSGGYTIAVKGAPEEIFSLCRLSEAETKRLMKEINRQAASGLRILGVASARGSTPPSSLSRGMAKFEFRGLIGFSDPIRPTAAEAIRECRHAGIRPIIVTGDYAGTAQYVARAVGIEDPDLSLTGEEISVMNDAQLSDAVSSVNVFARIAPTQKFRLVQALRAQGQVVAMTGDGINDAPALKEADVGIAMGKYGTDVAREAASLVLLDDDVSSIVEAIRTGRHIFDNIRKAASYIIAIHVPIASITLLPLFLRGPLVLLPSHIALLELIIDPACSVVFESEPPEDRVMDRPPRNIRTPLFTMKSMAFRIVQGCMVSVVAAGVYVGAYLVHWTENDIRTVTTLALISANVSLIVSNLSWGKLSLMALLLKNQTLPLLLAGVTGIVMVIYGIPFLRDIFHVSRITGGFALIAVTAGVISFILAEAIEALDRRNLFG